MRKIPFLLLIVLLTACSNPEDEAKKLGFSSHAEMVMMQKDGFKTKAEYDKKIEDEKNAEIKKIEKSKLEIESKLYDHAVTCYPPNAMMAAVYRQMNEKSEKAKMYYALEKAYKEILETVIRKEGDDDLVKIILMELELKYKPAQLKDEEVNTEYGKSIIADHAKLEQDCANFIVSNQDIQPKFFDILKKYQVEEIGGPTTNITSSGTPSNPKQIAEKIQIAGVSRCIAAATVMSVGLINDKNIRSDGPEIRKNSSLMEFYGEARKHLIATNNNPGVIGAFDDMIAQQGDYFGDMVRYQGWASFMPEYMQCDQMRINAP